MVHVNDGGMGVGVSQLEVNWYATRVFDCGLTMVNESGGAGIGGGQWEGFLGERGSCGRGISGEGKWCWDWW